MYQTLNIKRERSLTWNCIFPNYLQTTKHVIVKLDALPQNTSSVRANAKQDADDPDLCYSFKQLTISELEDWCYASQKRNNQLYADYSKEVMLKPLSGEKNLIFYCHVFTGTEKKDQSILKR